jgi:hypothetical protein
VNLAHYIGLLHRSECELAEALREVGEAHAEEVDVHTLTSRLATQCESHAEALAPFASRYGEEAADGPERLHSTLFEGARSGGLGLLRDLHDLYLLASYLDMAWTVVGQAGKGARDTELVDTVDRCAAQTSTQMSWITTRMKAAAPQALLVAD